MSVRVMADVWDAGPEDAVDSSVLVALANHCDDDGRSCFPSVERIARMVRRSQRTVERSIAALELAGWIEVQRGGGRGLFSSYTVNVELLGQRAADIREKHRKGRQAVADSRKPKERQPRQEKATATTEKATAAAPYKEEPSWNRQKNEDNTPPAPASGGVVCAEHAGVAEGDENGLEGAGLGASRAMGEAPAGPRFAGLRQAMESPAWAPAKREAELMAAAHAVQATCGVTSDERLVIAIEEALEAHCRRAKCTLKLARMLAIENVKAYIQDANLLRFKWGWKKFFRDGYWLEAKLWPYDQDRLRELKRTAQASIGMYEPSR